MEILKNVKLSSLTTMGVGGEAKEVVYPKNLEEFILAIDCPKFFILGNGSNVLASDKGYDGRIVCTKKIDAVGVNLDDESVLITCQAGVNLFKLNKICDAFCVAGLEFSYGIPGTVGGAVRMNAGAFGGQMSDVVEFCDIIEDGKIKRLREFDFSYRHSGLEDKIIFAVGFRLKLSCGIKEKQKEYLDKRKQSQPYSARSAGSIFKRTEACIPAQIIDKLGLKGVQINGAEVSKVHAGFIINSGSAKASDICELIDLIKRKVKAETGHELVEEIVYLE